MASRRTAVIFQRIVASRAPFIQPSKASCLFDGTAACVMASCRSKVVSVTQQRRSFGRKASKMGQHLVTLDELATREAHLQAKEKRKNKKKGKGRDTPSTPDDGNIVEVDGELFELDESETLFEHGTAIASGEIPPSLPQPSEIRARMQKVVTSMQESFKTIRGAEPSPELFDSVQVRAYGALTPLSSVAQVVISSGGASGSRAVVTCFDPQLTLSVRNAIRDAPSLDFYPLVEGDTSGVVTVPIPKPSAETRKALVKQLADMAESSRQRIRRIRREAQEVLKRAKDGKMEGISKDVVFRAGKDIDAVTEETVSELNRILESKQSSVLTV